MRKTLEQSLSEHVKDFMLVQTRNVQKDGQILMEQAQISFGPDRRLMKAPQIVLIHRQSNAPAFASYWAENGTFRKRGLRNFHDPAS
jgi:hypothetical protein